MVSSNPIRWQATCKQRLFSTLICILLNAMDAGLINVEKCTVWFMVFPLNSGGGSQKKLTHKPTPQDGFWLGTTQNDENCFEKWKLS